MQHSVKNNNVVTKISKRVTYHNDEDGPSMVALVDNVLIVGNMKITTENRFEDYIIMSFSFLMI